MVLKHEGDAKVEDEDNEPRHASSQERKPLKSGDVKSVDYLGVRKDDNKQRNASSDSEVKGFEENKHLDMEFAIETKPGIKNEASCKTEERIEVKPKDAVKLPVLDAAANFDDQKMVVDVKQESLKGEEEEKKMAIENLIKTFDVEMGYDNGVSCSPVVGVSQEARREPSSSLDRRSCSVPPLHEAIEMDHQSENSEQPDILIIKDEPQELDEVGCLSSFHHRKRQRFLGVFVKTWDELKQKREEDYKKIKNMMNPKAEKVKDMDFSLSILHDRLKDIGFDGYQVTLDEDIREFVVSRQFMSATYGGNTQDTFPKIRAALVAEHGYNDFMYVNVEYHPRGPQLPGQPGIFLNVNRKDRSGTWRVLTRMKSNEWLFVGMYCLQLCASLTKSEWDSLDIKVRKAWVHQIHGKSWGSGIRARIVARRQLGRKPTTAEWNAVPANERNNVTKDEIEKAFHAGEVQLLVSTMKCVGYDEAFQRQLWEKFPLWSKLATKSTKSKSRPQPQASPAAAGQKRKRKLTELESKDNEAREERPAKKTKKKTLNDNEGAEELTYRPRGTKSRPILL